MPPVNQNAARTLLSMAKTARDVIAAPATFGGVSLDSIILDLEAIASTDKATKQVCQVQTGADDVCGLPRNSVIHLPGRRDGHEFKAEVAQLAEQDFRKVEVAGSSPVPSSTGFTSKERDLMHQVVRCTNNVLESKKSVEKLQEELNKLEAETKGRAGVLRERITGGQEVVRFREIEMKTAEDNFRLSMINSAITPPLVEEKPLDVLQEESIDLGRTE